MHNLFMSLSLLFTSSGRSSAAWTPSDVVNKNYFHEISGTTCAIYATDIVPNISVHSVDCFSSILGY